MRVRLDAPVTFQSQPSFACNVVFPRLPGIPDEPCTRQLKTEPTSASK